MGTVFQLRLTEAEKASWEKAASEAGLSLAAWVRERCAGSLVVQDIAERMAEDVPTLCRRCARIGKASCEVCRKVVK